MFGYAKVFSQIFDSTIADDWQVRHVFEDLLKLANSDGVVDMTPESIAARTRMPLKMVQRAIAELVKPDERSRSKEHDGARIVLIDPKRDWGWWIVNHDKYRGLNTDAQYREKTRERVRKYRKKTRVTLRNVTKRYGNNKQEAVSKKQEARSTHTKEGVLDPNTCEPPKPNREPLKTDVQELKALLEGLFRRRPGASWGYLEETALVTVAKRPEVMAELQELKEFHGRIQGRWFPQTIQKLLENWTGTLDRARMPASAFKTEQDQKALDFMVPKLPQSYLTEL